MIEKILTINNTFKSDVNKGLSSSQKYLPSKYFYDKIGDSLFVKIMNMPEYYLTNSELDIFKNKTKDLIDALQIESDTEFDLIELGAGDGMKTKELLKVLASSGFRFNFIPVDISQNALNNIKNSIEKDLPSINITPKQGDYFDVLDDIAISSKPKVILFLGSNIGNMNDDKATKFMTNLSHVLNLNDKIILGVDLAKSINIILPAYNDKQGITKRFNLNLLHRINTELGADFNIECFEHQPVYNEEDGIAFSYLTSTKHQTVYIESLKKSFEFYEGERIHTETSRKYNDDILKNILRHTKLEIKDKLLDSKEYFADYILNKF